MKYPVIIFLIFIAFLQGCYYDKAFINNNTTCDTAIITYSGSVIPVLTAYCIGCHSGPNAPLGVNLDSYSGTKVQVINGDLLGAITHTPGHSPMPKSGNKLSDCNIAKIRVWIAAGAPNN